MTIPEAVMDLKKQVEDLSNAHAAMQVTLEKFGRHLEIARRNLEILQEAVIKKTAVSAAIPTGLN